MVIFHSYVKLPDGMGLKTCLCLNNNSCIRFAGQISSFVACVFVQKMIYMEPQIDGLSSHIDPKLQRNLASPHKGGSAAPGR